MNNFQILVYDLKDLKKPKKLIDEFTVNADFKNIAADLAHKAVEESIENSLEPYSDINICRLLIETKSL